MANVTINDLTADAAPVGTDEMEIQNAGGLDSSKIVLNQIPWKGGAMVELTSAETITISVDTAMPWDQIEYDTDSFWAGGQPTRLTIPAGVTRVRLHACISWEAEATMVPSYRQVRFKKDGAYTSQGLAGQSVLVSTDFNGAIIYTECTSPPLVVTAAQYFEVFVLHTHTTSTDVNADEQTYFGIEVLERTS